MTLRLPEELDVALTACAARERVSKNKLVEQLVAAHVIEGVQPLAQRRAHILALAAAFTEQDSAVLERL